ncbi:hypothetical protein NDU88_007157 [Pleurodeles waltl]|uniref:Uncharacterized protein n=1 Tax=Pleurodeles waltl TaxID=8319 RepID=A0AAV7VTM4_PLEWA|nr:hypothetical protein NDU88_007157 [Pleurodeles waltl]
MGKLPENREVPAAVRAAGARHPRNPRLSWQVNESRVQPGDGLERWWRSAGKSGRHLGFPRIHSFWLNIAFINFTAVLLTPVLALEPLVAGRSFSFGCRQKARAVATS